ncbi:MAG: UDP-3-O-acyl-N-acetylglucosamine deacetylase [Candidatus Omnitrophota bacterium]|nr:UDP-3-O-acyl-N-acetylglucosamine deacetylase [Candidatus Omnitrophota bacterium]
MDRQKTIAKEISISGIGLHTACKANILFKPAVCDSGINFIRVDLINKPIIKASVENLFFLNSSSPSSSGGLKDVLSAVGYSARHTCIGKDGAHVQTVEHLMAALFGLGIDNIIIEIDNNEVPGLDGSSLAFFELLKDSGIQEQDKQRRLFSIKEPLYVQEGSSSLVALPSSEFKISYALDYKHPSLPIEFLELSLNSDVFGVELAPSRTFCLQEEAEELQRQGYGAGANYENTLVVGKAGVIKNKLRFQDEFIRHKMLDLTGDLYLLGCPIKAHIIALKSGHSLNIKLVKKIWQQMERYIHAGIGAGCHPQGAGELDVTKIMKILPHREPFLFVDKITCLEQGRHAQGIKNVTINDYFFKGHFPGRPVMPGVLIIEAMAQVAGVMMLASEENQGKLAFFLAANNIKFRKTVVPGDQLVLDVVAGKIRAKTGQVSAKAYVDGKLVTEADLMFALVES